MRSEEMDSAHMVHKGGANPPSCLMHHSVSWTKYTAKPAKKTRKSWHTEKYKQIEMTTLENLNFFDTLTLDIWIPVSCLKGQLQKSFVVKGHTVPNFHFLGKMWPKINTYVHDDDAH